MTGYGLVIDRPLWNFISDPGCFQPIVCENHITSRSLPKMFLLREVMHKHARVSGGAQDTLIGDCTTFATIYRRGCASGAVRTVLLTGDGIKS